MNWKDKLNDLKGDLPPGDAPQTNETPSKKSKQQAPLRVEMEKRNGKPSTLITCFEGSDAELKELAKTLKLACGAGGSARDGEILIQGDFRVKIAALLVDLHFKVKKINFK